MKTRDLRSTATQNAWPEEANHEGTSEKPNAETFCKPMAYKYIYF